MFPGFVLTPEGSSGLGQFVGNSVSRTLSATNRVLTFGLKSMDEALAFYGSVLMFMVLMILGVVGVVLLYGAPLLPILLRRHRQTRCYLVGWVMGVAVALLGVGTFCLLQAITPVEFVDAKAESVFGGIAFVTFPSIPLLVVLLIMHPRRGRRQEPENENRTENRDC